MSTTTYVPTGTGTTAGAWSATGAALTSLHLALDEPTYSSTVIMDSKFVRSPFMLADDADFITLVFPELYTGRSSGRPLGGINGLTFTIRGRNLVTPLVAAFAVWLMDGVTPIFVTEIDFTNDATFTTRTSTLITAPESGSWTPTNLTNPSFRVTTRGDEIGGPQLDISMFRLTTDVVDVAGQGRWRKGPLLREEARICSFHGTPFHKSDLIHITDPRHPHAGYWVCRDDLDEINPEPTEPTLIEGDLAPGDD